MIQRGIGGKAEFVAPGDGGQLEQGQGGHGIAGGFGSVVIIFYAQDQITRPSTALPEAAMLRIEEFFQQGLRQGDSKLQMRGLQRGFI